jgi:hypothetical protein
MIQLKDLDMEMTEVLDIDLGLLVGAGYNQSTHFKPLYTTNSLSTVLGGSLDIGHSSTSIGYTNTTNSSGVGNSSVVKFSSDLSPNFAVTGSANLSNGNVSGGFTYQNGGFSATGSAGSGSFSLGADITLP